MSISVFVHIRTKPSDDDGLKGQAFFVGATTTTTYAGLYRIVAQTIHANIPLRNELTGKTWKLYHGDRKLPNTTQKTIGHLPRESFSSMNIALVVDKH